MLPQLEIEHYSSQIFWLIICIGIMYFALKYIFVPRLEKAIKSRQNHVKRLMREAKKMQTEADSLQKTYHEEIKKLHLEAHKKHMHEVDKFEELVDKKFHDLAKNQSSKFLEYSNELSNLEKEIDKKIEEESDKLLNIFVSKVNSEYENKK